MKARTTLIACAGLGALALIAGAGLQPEKDKAPAAPPDMEAWMAVANPGEQHKLLDQFVGTWDVKTSFIMDPSAPPQEGAGTATYTWILGNRWLRQEFKTEFMGQPFEGVGHWGYDNIQKKYVTTWMDTMMTGYMAMDCPEYDSASKSFSFAGEVVAPDGSKQKGRNVLTVNGPDQFTYVFFGAGPDGKEVKQGELVYTRSKTVKVRT